MAVEFYKKPNFGRRVRRVARTVLEAVIEAIKPYSAPVCVSDPIIVVEQIGAHLRIVVKDGFFVVADGDDIAPIEYEWRVNDVPLMNQHESHLDVEGNVVPGDAVVCVLRATSNGGMTVVETNVINFS